MVFLSLRAAWLRRQRAKANRANTGLRHVVNTRKLSPKSLVRYATTSRKAYESTAIERSRIAALKRVLRRRITHMRYFEKPEGVLKRNYIQQARAIAIARAGMSPATRKRNAQMRRVQAVRNAFGRMNPDNNAQWRRFVKMHVNIGGSPSITFKNAVKLYN